MSSSPGLLPPVAIGVHVLPSSLLRTTAGLPHTVSGTTTSPLASTRPLPWTIVAPVPPWTSPALHRPLIVGRNPVNSKWFPPSSDRQQPIDAATRTLGMKLQT